LIMDLEGRGITVLDYKTGKEVHHINNDVVSCVQTLLYCMMLGQKEYPDKALGTTYLYPLPEEAVSCKFDETVKKEIQEMFTESIRSMETGEDWTFSDEPEKAADCKWCKWKAFCTAPILIGNRLFEEENRNDD